MGLHLHTRGLSAFPIITTISSHATNVTTEDGTTDEIFSRLPPNYHNRLLASLLGTFICCILYGIIVVLANRYFRLAKGKTFEKMKWIVAFVVFLQTLMNVAGVTKFSLLHAAHWGDVNYFLKPGDEWADAILSVTTILLQAQCQLFIWYRGLQLSKLVTWNKTWVKAVLWITFIFTVLNVPLGIVGGMFIIFKFGIISHLQGFEGILTGWITVSLVVDVSLSFFLVAELRNAKNSLTATSVRVRSIIDNIIVYIICSGTLLWISQAVVVALAIWEGVEGSDQAAWSLFMVTILPSIYSVSFLVILLSGPDRGEQTEQSQAVTTPLRKSPGRTKSWLRGSSTWPSLPKEEVRIEMPARGSGQFSPVEGTPSRNFGMGRGISKYIIKEEEIISDTGGSTDSQADRSLSRASGRRQDGTVSRASNMNIVSVELQEVAVSDRDSTVDIDDFGKVV
ncbi:hypothetical protein BT69DRAFT_886751 [Atractiella rhizophila]|nr:hypothetical protein BT69DRAFT_886751 [Atractiella rhizophila]